MGHVPAGQVGGTVRNMRSQKQVKWVAQSEIYDGRSRSSGWHDLEYAMTQAGQVGGTIWNMLGHKQVKRVAQHDSG